MVAPLLVGAVCGALVSWRLGGKHPPKRRWQKRWRGAQRRMFSSHYTYVSIIRRIRKLPGEMTLNADDSSSPRSANARDTAFAFACEDNPERFQTSALLCS